MDSFSMYSGAKAGRHSQFRSRLGQRLKSRRIRVNAISPGIVITPGYEEQIRCGRTLLISGGTASGKTTLLKVMAQAIPDNERIVIIEDTSELRIQKPNVLAVECQTDTFKARITFDDLLKSALRWRPDRIILGEVCRVEARTLLDSFNTGHVGSLATIHANSAEKALHRFANLVMRSQTKTTLVDTEAEIGDPVDFIVHIARQFPASCWSHRQLLV